MVLPIVTGLESDILHQKTQKVTQVNKDVKKLLKDMEETTIAADGLGIAGPQVGQSLRVCIVKIGKKFMPLINPEITFKGEDTDVAEEGCLSLPGIWRHIRRPTKVAVTYQDIKGKEQERILEGLDARVVQHEVDHLDGVLITDYSEEKVVPMLEKEMI